MFLLFSALFAKCDFFLKLTSHWKIFSKQLLLKKTFKGIHQITSLSKVTKGNHSPKYLVHLKKLHAPIACLDVGNSNFPNIGKSVQYPQTISKPNHYWNS